MGELERTAQGEFEIPDELPCSILRIRLKHVV
jgi:hypothetical protein